MGKGLGTRNRAYSNHTGLAGDCWESSVCRIEISRTHSSVGNGSIGGNGSGSGNHILAEGELILPLFSYIDDGILNKWLWLLLLVVRAQSVDSSPVKRSIITPVKWDIIESASADHTL